jgi:hypothetical protein
MSPGATPGARLLIAPLNLAEGSHLAYLVAALVLAADDVVALKASKFPSISTSFNTCEENRN